MSRGRGMSREKNRGTVLFRASKIYFSAVTLTALELSPLMYLRYFCVLYYV